MRTVLPAALALSLGACSFIGVSGPSSAKPKPAPATCTTSMVAPSLDGVAAVTFGLLALTMFANANEGDEGGLHAVFLGVPGALLAATYGASSTYGYRAVSACRDLEDDRS